MLNLLHTLKTFINIGNKVTIFFIQLGCNQNTFLTKGPLKMKLILRRLVEKWEEDYKFWKESANQSTSQWRCINLDPLGTPTVMARPLMITIFIPIIHTNIRRHIFNISQNKTNQVKIVIASGYDCVSGQGDHCDAHMTMNKLRDRIHK